ncbi:hypothetical protein NP493_403g05010 [Ridgeia piscesae]|uniref:Uncharacterized protein n=1 Tax=Ridgeia piscesae TaxID=27915 RepID=A0AAD9NUP7_RIDPI|nr:hypothetical protein NP493_403g05010 [Ridgeia piscesae]
MISLVESNCSQGDILPTIRLLQSSLVSSMSDLVSAARLFLAGPLKNSRLKRGFTTGTHAKSKPLLTASFRVPFMSGLLVKSLPQDTR